MTNSDDLFDQLREACGCIYGSDLHREPYRSMAAKQMVTMDLQGYSLKLLSDIADYLFYDMPEFQDVDSARRYFAMKIHEA